MTLPIKEWNEEDIIMLSSSLDNLRLLKLMWDSGYPLPLNAQFVEDDVSAEHAIDLFFDATQSVLGEMEFTSVLDEDGKEDDSYDYYQYQPGTIVHQKLSDLYVLATEPGDEERIADAIEPYMYENNDSFDPYNSSSLVLSVNEERDGYVMEIYQFDWSFCSAFVEMFIELDRKVQSLLTEFKTRERRKGLMKLQMAL